jgi:hypothetical protein
MKLNENESKGDKGEWDSQGEKPDRREADPNEKKN